MGIELSEKEIKFLKQYASVFDAERKIDCTNDPIVVVEDIEKIITQWGYEDEIDKDNDGNDYPVQIIYKPVAYFLTRAEAERYCKYQKHNLTRPRVYTRYCGYANHGDLQCLSKMLLRLGNELLGQKQEEQNG